MRGLVPWFPTLTAPPSQGTHTHTEKAQHTCSVQTTRGPMLMLTVDEEGGVSSVVNQEVGGIGIWPGQSLLCAPPVLLQGLSLPGKDSG
jgi:hypothetical protein